jgi:hypothetical protein
MQQTFPAEAATDMGHFVLRDLSNTQRALAGLDLSADVA